MSYRPTKAYINLIALEHNFKTLQQLAPNSKMLAVIKANGYGHGMLRVAKTLAKADGFAVESLDSALELRQQGFLHRIVLLEGVFNEHELLLAQQNRLDLVVHSEYQVEWLSNQSLAGLGALWLKIDSGMHRLGFDLSQVDTVIERLQQSSSDFKIYLMSHFACADEHSEQGLQFTQLQLERFNSISQKHDFKRSFANSAALQCYPQSHFEWVRPGISLYGASDFTAKQSLKAVMQLQSSVIAIKTIGSGESVGYGQTWQAEQDTTIAVVAVGYGDGYPRHAPNGTPVLINNYRVPLVGRVSMDMITVDITTIADQVQLGDSAVLWGDELSVDEIANACGTIGYELLCGVTARVPRIEIVQQSKDGNLQS